MLNNIQSNMTGLAGELRVMSELLLRGHNPAKSYLEHGADLVLENGLRIEVKSKHVSMKVHDRYSFSFRGGARQQNQGLQHCDFVICWCIDENSFYIVPMSEVKTSSICVYSKSSRRQWTKYAPYRENWELLNRR